MRTFHKIMTAIVAIPCPAFAMWAIEVDVEAKGWWYEHPFVAVWVMCGLAAYNIIQFAGLAFMLTYPW